MRPLRTLLILGFVCQASLFVCLTEATAIEFACGDVRYIIKKTLFSSEVSILNGAAERPYCVSDTPDEITTNLIIKDTEIWCTKFFYITIDRQPYAKSSQLLNLTLGQVVTHDYVRQNGAWDKTDTHITKCPREKHTKREKVPG